MRKQAGTLRLWLLLFFLLGVAAAEAQQTAPPATITVVDSVGMTVSNLDRSVEFYSQVLSFEKVSEVEVSGSEYDRLQGVFGLRMRIARLQLGDEHIELTEYLTPKGRPIPVDSRSNDRWFQHIAIIVRDMDRAYHWLRENRVEHVSPARNASRNGIRMREAFVPSTFATRMTTRWKFSSFLPTRGPPSGIVRPRSCSWESTIRP